MIIAYFRFFFILKKKIHFYSKQLFSLEKPPSKVAKKNCKICLIQLIWNLIQDWDQAIIFNLIIFSAFDIFLLFRKLHNLSHSTDLEFDIRLGSSHYIQPNNIYYLVPSIYSYCSKSLISKTISVHCYL